MMAKITGDGIISIAKRVILMHEVSSKKRIYQACESMGISVRTCQSYLRQLGFSAHEKPNGPYRRDILAMREYLELVSDEYEEVEK